MFDSPLSPDHSIGRRGDSDDSGAHLGGRHDFVIRPAVVFPPPYFFDPLQTNNFELSLDPPRLYLFLTNRLQYWVIDRAANRIVLGRTRGRGHRAPTKQPTRPIKDVLGYPLTPDFRARLTAD